MQHFVGPANRFVCHCWKSSFSGLIEGLLDTVHEADAILWIDIFSMQLHQDEASQKGEAFHLDDVENVMSRMTSFSLSLQPLMHPATFENRWLVIAALKIHSQSHVLRRCLFECAIFLKAQPSAVFDVVLSPEDYLQLSSQLHVVSHITSIEQAFGHIRLETSNAAHYIRVPTMSIVPHGISKSYFRLNEDFFHKIRSWFIKTLKQHVDKYILVNDDFCLNLLNIAVSKFFQRTDDNFSLLPFLSSVFRYKRARFGQYHAETVLHMFEYAKCMHKLQRYHEAISLYQQCLHIKSVISGLEDTTVLSVKNELAILMLKFFSIDNAFNLLETCVTNRHALLGAYHADTLDSEFHLSWALSLKNQFDSALNLIESCLDRRVRLFGLEHPVTLQTMSCRAQIAFKRMRDSKLTAAKVNSNQIEIVSLFTVCLAKQEMILGKLHDDTVLTRNSLASAYCSLGDLRRARCLFSECLRAIESTFGPSHPTRFSTMRCLASVEMAAGEAFTAEQIYKDCLSDLRNFVGVQHPITLMTMEDLSHVFVSLEKYEDALSLFQECSDAWTSMGYPFRSLLIDTYRAATLRIQGFLTKAHTVAYESLSRSHSLLGSEHSITVGLQAELCDILYAAAKWADVKVLCKRMLERKLSTVGSDNLFVIRLMSKLAHVYEMLKKYSKSRNLRIFVYNFYVKDLGGCHPDTIDSMSNLARCMFLCDNLDDCERLAVSCLESLRSLRHHDVEAQQQLRHILDAVRRRRIQIETLEKESDDDLVQAIKLSMSLI
jgi:tetratricopeptide (TPR) repeat protein